MRYRPEKAAAGFTLLEIILAVGIGVIFMGGAVVFLSSTGEDREIRRAREIFEEAAGLAREKALGSGQSQLVLLEEKAVNGEALPEGVEMGLITTEDLVAGRRSWGKPPEEGFRWLVTGGGLVEPIRVRLRHAGNEEQFSFSALTGESITEKAERGR
jgi:type II secretory pathway pseudopilin PulG